MMISKIKKTNSDVNTPSVGDRNAMTSTFQYAIHKLCFLAGARPPVLCASAQQYLRYFSFKASYHHGFDYKR